MEKLTAEQIMESPLFVMVEKLVKSIDMLTTAINYHSSVIGYKADDINTSTSGKPIAMLELSVEAPQEAPEPSNAASQNPVSGEQWSPEDVKAALNAFAKKHGKDKALAVLEKYQADKDIKKLSQHHYADIIKEVA